jgi:peptidoglycan hydrolase-like protein with peptidoglycan-binding domain
MKQEFTFEAEPFRQYGIFNELPGPNFESFEAESDFEWLGEVSRSSPDYVRWIQESLNSVMGLRLAVDGIIGPLTRSATRSFQQKAGLVADGIVGPKTESALIAAGASPFDGGGTIPPPNTLPPLTYAEVRSDRIDVDAQRSLLRMSNQPDPSARADAHGLAQAVNTGQLTGIYAEDQAVPAKLAIRLGTTWWQLIPPGEDAALILEPGSTVAAPPTIAFRKKLRSQPAQLDAALRKAWRTFQRLRAGNVAPCPTKPPGLLADVSFSNPPISNLVPPIFCASPGGATCQPVQTSVTTRAPLVNPNSRPCCILAPTLSPFNSSSNIVDPTSIGQHASPTEANGIIYSGGAGFLDLGHIRDLCDLTKFVFDQMMAAGGSPANVVTLHGSAKFSKCPADVISVARAISLDDGLGHEIVSYDVFTPGMHNSAFSPEDLCSNFLGSLLAQRAIAAGGSFNSAVDSELDKLLTSLGAQSVSETQKAFGLINGRWISFAGPISLTQNTYLQRRNFTQTPFKAGHSSDSATPAFVTTLLPDFSSVYSYTHLEQGKSIPRISFAAEIARIKVDAVKRYGADFDKP